MVASGCQSPGCTHKDHPDNQSLFLAGKCHPHQGLSVQYTRGAGLTMRCQVCSRVVAKIAVAVALPQTNESDPVADFLEGKA